MYICLWAALWMSTYREVYLEIKVVSHAQTKPVQTWTRKATFNAKIL